MVTPRTEPQGSPMLEAGTNDGDRIVVVVVVVVVGSGMVVEVVDGEVEVVRSGAEVDDDATRSGEESATHAATTSRPRPRAAIRPFTSRRTRPPVAEKPQAPAAVRIRAHLSELDVHGR